MKWVLSWPVLPPPHKFFFFFFYNPFTRILHNPLTNQQTNRERWKQGKKCSPFWSNDNLRVWKFQSNSIYFTLFLHTLMRVLMSEAKVYLIHRKTMFCPEPFHIVALHLSSIAVLWDRILCSLPPCISRFASMFFSPPSALQPRLLFLFQLTHTEQPPSKTSL